MRNFLRGTGSWIFLISVMCLIGIVGSVSIFNIGKSNDERRAARQVWFDKHQCKKDGYTGREMQLYKCDDGVQYIWYDIPTKD